LLIGLRVRQGLTAGLPIPAGQTVIGRAVGSRRLGVVVATLGVAVAPTPAFGPTVGGVVIHVASWPWPFLVNVPVGALGLLLGLRYVPQGEAVRVGRLDCRGLLLVTAGLPLVVFGPRSPPSPRTPAAVTTLSSTLRLFSRPAYAAASATAAFTGAAMFGAGLLFPLYFKIGHHQSVLRPGCW
jgi:MFS family permease